MRKLSVLVIAASACTRVAPAAEGGTSKPVAKVEVDCAWTGRYVPDDMKGNTQVPELRCTNHTAVDVTKIGVAYYFYDAAGVQIWRDPDAPGKATKQKPDTRAGYVTTSSGSVAPAGKTVMLVVGPEQTDVPPGASQLEVEVTTLSYADGTNWDGPVEPFPSGRPLHGH